NSGKNALPRLDYEDWDETYYLLPEQKEVNTVYSRVIEKEDILESIKNPDNHLMNKMKKLVSDDELEERTIEPAMPLKTTHLATTIASGSITETNDDNLLVSLRKQEESHKSVEDEKGDVRDITTTNTKSIVRVFSHKGICNLQDD